MRPPLKCPPDGGRGASSQSPHEVLADNVLHASNDYAPRGRNDATSVPRDNAMSLTGASGLVGQSSSTKTSFWMRPWPLSYPQNPSR